MKVIYLRASLAQSTPKCHLSLLISADVTPSPYHADDTLLLRIPTYFESFLFPFLSPSFSPFLIHPTKGVEVTLEDYIPVYTRLNDYIHIYLYTGLKGIVATLSVWRKLRSETLFPGSRELARLSNASSTTETLKESFQTLRNTPSSQKKSTTYIHVVCLSSILLPHVNV